MVRTVPNRVQVVYDHKGYKTGDVFFILNYVGEGFAKVWFQGEIREEDIAALPSGGFHHPKATAAKLQIPDAKCWWNVESAERQSTWWVKVKTTTGLVVWTISNGNFDNQDVLG